MVADGTCQYNFALSAFTRTERMELCLKIAALGGVYNENTRDCSHIVCKHPARMEKYLSGCAMGKWVLMPKYIEDSYTHGDWLGESTYEWGSKNILQLPQNMRCLLMAPHKWRVKLATTQSGAFSNWRVAILVKNQSSKAVFTRLLECGSATVGEITLPEGGAIDSGLTHVFHDGSESFACIVKTLQLMGIPCLPLVYISDYLLKTGDMAPDRRRSRHRFVLTGFSHKERSELSLKIATLGGVYNETKQLQRDCSHVVCKVPARTEKFLAGCAMGKWILKAQYIHDSYHQGHWVGESEYEWGPQDTDDVPPSMQCLLSAPLRCRVKSTTTLRRTFHGWRVAILVKNQSSKAVFKRLLECGGAKVEEMRQLAGRRKISCLTHIFHDGSMCFADMLKPYRQMGIPCLKPVYISDCLLGEQLPDMEVYRTVDGVIVWPQLSHCSLVSSQSSSSTVSSSSTTDPNVSPIHPLSSKDINTAMSLKTTTTKMLKTPKTMCLQVRSASPSPKTGRNVVGRIKATSTPLKQNRRSRPSSSDTDLVRKTRTSKRHKPLQKGQTLLGNFCQILHRPQTNKPNISHMLGDSAAQGCGDYFATPNSECKVERSEVKGHVGWTKGALTVVGKVVPVKLMPTEQMGTMSDCQVHRQKMGMSGQPKGTLTVVGKIVPFKSMPSDELRSYKRSLDCKVKRQMTTITECDMAQQNSTQDVGIVQSSTQVMEMLRQSLTQDTDKVQQNSVQHPKIVQQNSKQEMEIVDHCSTKDIEIFELSSTEDVEIVELSSTDDVEIVELSSTEEIVQQSSVTDAEIAQQCSMKDAEIAQQCSTEDAEIAQQSSMKDNEIAQQCSMKDNEIAQQCSMKDNEIAQQCSMKDNEIAQQCSTEDAEIAQQCSMKDNEIARQSFIEDTIIAPQNLIQMSTEANLDSSKEKPLSDVPMRTVTKHKADVDESTEMMAGVRKKQKEDRSLATMSPFMKSSEVRTKLRLPWPYPTCAMFEACLDDDELFYAADIVSLSVSTVRYPTARVIHLILCRILLPSRSVTLSHKVHCLLHSIVLEHSPVYPSMQCVYLNAINYHDENSTQSEYCHPTQFLFSVISALLTEEHEEDVSRNYLLCLEFLVTLFERDFSIFIQHRQLGGEDKKGVPRSSLIGQIFWPAGRMGHLNAPCKQLLSFFSRSLQLGTNYKSELLQLLHRLVAMVAEHHRLVDCTVRCPPNRTQLPHTAVMFARELAYRIKGAMTYSTPDIAGGLHEAVGGLRVPWLCVRVCQTMLDLYDDTLLPASLQNPPLQITFSTIVSRYFYLLPRQQERAMIDYIHSLDVDSSDISIRTAEPEAFQKMTDSKYRTRASKMAARSANNRNCKGETTLHLACSSNNVAKVKELLTVPGIEINCQDHAGYTPLHQAALRGHIDCVASLLKYKPTNSILSFLKCDSVDGRPSGVRLDVVTKSGASVLHAAIAENQLQVVHMLLQFGGKGLLHLRNSDGQTPLRLAVSEEMRQLLHDLPSPCKVPFNCSQDSQGSQSSCDKSSESQSQSDSPPTDGAYRNGLDPHTPVTREECGNYVYLVYCFVLSYIRLHSLCPARHSKSQPSTDSVKSRYNTSVTDGDTSVTNGDAEIEKLGNDIQTLKHLHRHVSNFRMHLRRIIGGSTLEFCQIDLIALQTLASAMQ